VNGLDLFSGIGGISLALREWVTPTVYCENDRYAQGVLLSRMASGELPRAPIWDDVRTLGRDCLIEPVDIIYGGFPCQDISAAGRGRGLAGERSGLFFEIVRLTSEIQPTFVFLENVPAIRTRGLREVVRAFTDLRYDCRWTCVSAAELGAPHLRKRWFLLAHANGMRLREEQRPANSERPRPLFANDNGETQFLADTCGERLQGRGLEGGLRETPGDRPATSAQRRSSAPDVADSASANGEWVGTESNGKQSGPANAGWWAIEPNVGRVADGVPLRVDRLRGLGNAVVPLQAKTSFERLLGKERIT
jgi:DNA (cytosine-5)-methyltransferase 1